ncbi:MAG: exo-alpha-sialidase [Opitutaceae bacterium]|jgi:sialidase-1|nr:exo-alpha-sialidase [Opitutaceae bacterium]
MHPSFFPRSLVLTFTLAAGVLTALTPGHAAGVTGLAGTTAPALPTSRSVLELPPSKGNARNSEGSFVTLKDGRILFVYSHFVGDAYDDHAKAVLAARISTDNGDTWSGDTVIATPGEDKAMNVMSVSLLRLGNGDIGLFYCLRNSWHDLRMQLRRSSDEGRTWSDPVMCMHASEYYVVNNDRVIRLSSGRLLIPAAWHRKITDANVPESLDWRAIATFFLSDDDGRTWRESSMACTLPSPHTRAGLQEPGVTEMANGVLWGYARTDLGRQWEFFSSDGGETWTTPQPSRFSSPVSPLSMKRLPGSNQLLAVWNPIPNYQTRPLEKPSGDRTPLVGAIGVGITDATWGPTFLVDRNDVDHEGYCYTAIHFTGKSVLLAYCAGGKADTHRLNRLRIRKIDLSAFTAFAPKAK